MVNTMRGQNTDLLSKLNTIMNILSNNELICEICSKAKELNLKNYYIGAGFIAQSIWNHLSEKSLNYGIKDIDIVYFDEDLSYEKENTIIEIASELFKDSSLEVDIKNQARVHLWYKQHFGNYIKPYSSVEEAINTWPTTATAIGVRLNKSNKWEIYAPFGLNDVLGKIIRANKVQITQEIYEKKVERWIKYWPDLTVIPWDR